MTLVIYLSNGGVPLSEDASRYIQTLELENARLNRELARTRRQAETALRWSEEKFAKAFDNNLTMMYLVRLADTAIVAANKKASQVTGYQQGELLGKSAVDFWANPHKIAAVMEQIDQFGYIENYETELLNKSGEIYSALAAANQIELDGEMHLIVSIIDITERKKNEAALRSSEELFSAAFNMNPLAMAIVSKANGEFRGINSAFGEGTGYLDELLTPGVSDRMLWVKPSERDEFMARIDQEQYVRNFPATITGKSGEIFSILLSGVVIDWQGEKCILTVTNNITELRRYQEEVSRLDRLNMIGEMSASIAHEIRNPMTTVRGFLQMFENPDSYFRNSQYIALMINELDRANSIITQFLSLAKNKPINLEPININENIRMILPLLQAQAMKNDINIELAMGEISSLMMDRNEIHQLVLNLVLNGIDAMPQGGVLTIKTHQDNNGVSLAVEDQGPGIPAEVLSKIYTPFFTTKPHGTGLGLAVCNSIALRHHARIGVETGSAGSVFQVVFPEAAM